MSKEVKGSHWERSSRQFGQKWEDLSESEKKEWYLSTTKEVIEDFSQEDFEIYSATTQQELNCLKTTGNMDFENVEPMFFEMIQKFSILRHDDAEIYKVLTPSKGFKYVSHNKEILRNAKKVDKSRNILLTISAFVFVIGIIVAFCKIGLNFIYIIGLVAGVLTYIICSRWNVYITAGIIKCPKCDDYNVCAERKIVDGQPSKNLKNVKSFCCTHCGHKWENPSFHSQKD